MIGIHKHAQPKREREREKRFICGGFRKREREKKRFLCGGFRKRERKRGGKGDWQKKMHMVKL